MKRRDLLLAAAQTAGGVALIVGLPGITGARAATPSSGDIARGVIALAFEPASHSLLKASADGLFRSDDGGQRWTRVGVAPASASRHIASVAVAAGGKGVLYVGGPGLGVLRSDDGGHRWIARNTGLPSTAVASLTAHADRPETVYVYIDGKGIYRSEDGGRRWRLMDAGPRGGLTRFVHSNMSGSMQSGWLFAAAPQGVRRSMDCFCGWRDAGRLAGPVHAVAFDPGKPGTVYAATAAGLAKSGDGGETWGPATAAPVPIGALAVTSEGMLLAGAVDGHLYRRLCEKSWERVDA